ncbi:helicase-exonuclease AddAB subunit AddA [Edaphobacillus lindanitolerans]|uniref:ATP-dependent helicase/nuclease subunit A n=1 Tax=Edaphobacillus lindanitolerans TaxID=550447 RepID=A0A1U7PJU0_9BACI|nr:helicase-exonuclease AddAB subunit AddA [Edaphobacillus lindanitolerans]SIT69000.1 DNA helicase/exodeoxyribonuclease V, subunit A [Edaphobacillus lindanitolerans]
MNIPAKPADATWTDAQWQAIHATGSDILVSAAAGSGKTAVLINRLIGKVTDPASPIDVDELLVVTFTNAAAAEMRHRMASALEEAIAKNPQSSRLRRQLSLLNKAQISTLHSFCLNVVRQYAYILDVDPGFRIADTAEAALIRDDVIGRVLEEAYGSDDPEPVYRLADSFTSDRDDQAIEVLVDRLYDYSRVHPQPEEWLKSIPRAYHLPEGADIDHLPFIGPLKEAIRHRLEEAAAMSGEIGRIARMPDGPSPFAVTAEEDAMTLSVLLRILKEGTWAEAHTAFSALTWSRAAAIKKDSCDEELAERAKKKRNDVKKIVNSLKEAYFVRTPDRLLDEMRLMAPMMDTLIGLTIRFGRRYAQVKKDRGIVDFSDLEHLALAILSEEEDGRLVPSPVALDFRERFKEVLVDEYQDTNRLQETIIGLVKQGGNEDGNLFMVGDVKQSIYRFRLAEPMLFLGKYLRFGGEAEDSGLKIDLNANFRSRSQVLEATNYVFSQVMGARVGEIDYDEAAALKPGAPYPDGGMPTALTIIHEPSEEDPEAAEEPVSAEGLGRGETVKQSQAEARAMIREIRRLMDAGTPVTDPWSGKQRPLEYRDIVILLRSMTWSGEIADEFRLAGIPVYADTSGGYFDALEVMIMLNTLRVIDNPYQDIPFASVLRSPFIGLGENELARIRLAAPDEPFYEALKQFVRNGIASGIPAATEEKIRRFYIHFENWRNLARRGSLADLIWQVYIDTHYYEMAGAMPNGKQRQANLRALHDRAIQYERTSFRGLFRFLRFIDRMRRRGDDMGTARAVGERDDVVRIMTIHSSKGLEFPHVFIAGVGRSFNKMDFNEPYLFDQHFGLAVKAVDPDNRIQYTSLPFLAIREKKELEMRAEEMRILYVAMTRAKEGLHLVGSVKDLPAAVMKWQEGQLAPADAMLPEYVRSRAAGYLDWIGPAVARHRDFEPFGTLPGARLIDDPSDWKVAFIPSGDLSAEEAAAGEPPAEHAADRENAEEELAAAARVRQVFDYSYPHASSVLKRSKQSVSEVKRMWLLERAEEPDPFMTRSDEIRPVYMHDRPEFMQERTLSAAEIGTAVHAVMQHADLSSPQNVRDIQKLITGLADREIITPAEAREVDASSIARFFASPLYGRIRKSDDVRREVPFTYGYDAGEGDRQIIQGIVDCLFREGDGWVLLDYKTDRTRMFGSEEALAAEMENRYAVQLSLYARALRDILNIEIKEKLLYLFDGERVISIRGDHFDDFETDRIG